MHPHLTHLTLLRLLAGLSLGLLPRLWLLRLLAGLWLLGLARLALRLTLGLLPRLGLLGLLPWLLAGLRLLGLALGLTLIAVRHDSTSRWFKTPDQDDRERVTGPGTRFYHGRGGTR
jgi:hypothetical protein